MAKEPLLTIKNLNAHIDHKNILKNVNLTLNRGEVHVLMGPNGSGKSTLAHLLARKPGIQITGGTVLYNHENLLEFSPEVCAHKGIFLSFQYPVGIPGVSNIQFLKSAVNTVRMKRGEDPLDAVDFLELVKKHAKTLQMDESLLYRPLNDGFSGGEKKRNEILQLALLEPYLAILDETDSGLDIDALKIVAQGINQFKRADRAILLITHYQRLLDYVKPDFVHVFSEGTIVKSGNSSLALELEKAGYSWLQDE